MSDSKARAAGRFYLLCTGVDRFTPAEELLSTLLRLTFFHPLFAHQNCVSQASRANFGFQGPLATNTIAVVEFSILETRHS